MTENSEPSPSIRDRLAHELKAYAVVSLYLYICFCVVLIYEASQSADTDGTVLTFGIAAVKALVLGKFILIGEALGAGTRISAPTLLHRVMWRALGMMVILVVLKILEELVVGLAHGHTARSIIAELEDMSLLSLLGPVLLMLLVLIPLTVAIELNRVLGDKGLKALFLRRE